MEFKLNTGCYTRRISRCARMRSVSGRIPISWVMASGDLRLMSRFFETR